MHGRLLWNSFFDFLPSARSRSSLIWHSMRAGRARARAPQGKVWPMPLPFPELRLPRGNRSQVDVDRKLALNYVVIILNSMKFEKGKCAGFFPGLGTRLNAEQWGLIKRLTPHVDVWNAMPPVGPEEMGRAAAKVESVEEMLEKLLRFTDSIPSCGGVRGYGRSNYKSEVGASDVDEVASAAGLCEVMGDRKSVV